MSVDLSDFCASDCSVEITQVTLGSLKAQTNLTEELKTINFNCTIIDRDIYHKSLNLKNSFLNGEITILSQENIDVCNCLSKCISQYYGSNNSKIRNYLNLCDNAKLDSFCHKLSCRFFGKYLFFAKYCSFIF